MLTNNLGYPRIGNQRQLKKANEAYWAGKLDRKDLLLEGKNIRVHNWKLQQEAGIDLIPSNDFSFYDQVLDHSLMFGAIPERYHEIILKANHAELDLYFAMARGYQKNDLDIPAMEMTKWFDTNYHYIVPEFTKNQEFKLFSTKIIDEYREALHLGIKTKPVLLSPVSYLLLGKEKEAGFHRLDLLPKLLPIYVEIIQQLEALKVEWIQIDEPFLALDIDDEVKNAIKKTYNTLHQKFPHTKFLLTTYFEGLKENTAFALQLPIQALHLDLVRAPEQLNTVLDQYSQNIIISLGVVDGRNIWKNDLQKSLKIIQKAQDTLGDSNVFIAPSCSLIHAPCDLDLETNEKNLSAEIKQWMAFAKQKLTEVSALKALALDDKSPELQNYYIANQEAMQSKSVSKIIHNPDVQQRTAQLPKNIDQREAVFATRKKEQKALLNLPLYPTTTIGSFPQTQELRQQRAKFKKNEISAEAYQKYLEKETKEAILWQESIDMDVLVHGEFERNDMVEYFGELLEGFAFSKNGWVQSYGSRCVKPPIIYGDVSRPNAMTVNWTAYAQSLTQKWVKGMLTGPVTILQWSFVRNDQSRAATCNQIALAIRDEVVDLEKAGIKIIQIDEPAIREGLPLRKAEWENYLDWAVKAFRISASGVQNNTQIHTHMCYSEFNDIIKSIAAMDADVITIECSRSQMELLDAFADFNYPNEIGPGVYDIHSPRVPSEEEMLALLQKAKKVIPEDLLWVNPDCGLKTRHWAETKLALDTMVSAAKALRKTSAVEK